MSEIAPDDFLWIKEQLHGILQREIEILATLDQSVRLLTKRIDALEKKLS